MFHSLPTATLYAAHRIISKFQDEFGKQHLFAGTAFFIRRNHIPYLVTNKHCIDRGCAGAKYRDWKILSIRLSGYQRDGSQILRDFDASDMSIAIPANASEDVAVLMGPLGDIDGFVTLGFRELATDDDLATLSVCDALAFPGYPDWYDRSGDRPIMRMGSVASDPASDYRGTDQALPGRRIAYEAFSFGGSSGSPVFALEKGVRPGGAIVDADYRKGMIVGINAGHLNVSKSEDQGQCGAHSGISYLFKSTVIRDLIEEK